MKTAKFFTFLLLAIAVTAGVTGCKKTPKSPTPLFSRTGAAPGTNSPGGIENAAPIVPGPGETDSTVIPRSTNPDGSSPLAARPGDLSNFDQDRETFRQDTVYFEYDKYNVQAEEMGKVENVANFLKGQSTLAVLVEGHCDERGTPEYNRALGERRALSVREALINLGVNGDRVHTTSYGEDQPVESGQSEAAYARNRRGEFVLLRPKAGAVGSTAP